MTYHVLFFDDVLFVGALQYNHHCTERAPINKKLVVRKNRGDDSGDLLLISKSFRANLHIPFQKVKVKIDH